MQELIKASTNLGHIFNKDKSKLVLLKRLGVTNPKITNLGDQDSLEGKDENKEQSKLQGQLNGFKMGNDDQITNFITDSKNFLDNLIDGYGAFFVF